MALKLKGSTSGFVGLDAPAVAGNNTLILPENSGSAFQLFGNDITAGVTTFTQVTVSRNGDLTVPGTISIGGTLTYEDVTSVDSVGIVTARGLSIFGNTTGLQVASGISTFQTATFTGTAAQVELIGNEGISAAIRLTADQGDDNGDGWEIRSNQDDNDLTISNNTSGSYVDKFTLLKTGELTLTNDLAIPDKIIHAQDSDTAIRFPAADTITAETAGSERLRITSGGVVQIGGATANSADIDTSNTKLTIKQSAGAKEDGIYIEREGERRGHYIYVGGALSQSDALCISTNQLGGDTDLLAIDRGGNVAIGPGGLLLGTTVLNERAHIHTASSAKAQIQISNTTTGTSASDGFTFGITGGEEVVFANQENTDMYFSTNNTERLRIQNDGNIGINNDSPAYPLDVVGDGGGSFSASSNSTSGVLSVVGKNSSGSVSAISRIRSYPDGSSNQSHMAFETRNSSNTMVERVRIGSSGEVTFKRGGISATPSFEIFGSGNAGDASADNLRFHNWGDSNGDYWQIGVNATLDANGNNAKPSTSIKGAAIRLNGKNGSVTLITSPASTSTQYEGLTQNQDGYHTNANQPVFAYKGLGNTQSGSRMTTDGDMLFTSATISSSHYNNSNGRFTAPVTGKYYFQVNALLDNDASAGTRVIRLKVNGSIITTIVYNYFEDDPSNQYYHCSGGAVLSLSASDYVTFFGSEGWHVGVETNVSGFLIC